MKKYKFSKIYVAAILYRYAFLLFVPILQGILFAESGGMLLFTLYSTDLIVLVLLIIIAVIRCSKSSLIYDRNLLEIKSGVVIKTNETAFTDKRVSFLFTDGFFLRLMGGCKLKLFAGSTYSSAYLKQKDKKEILNLLLPELPKKIICSGIFRSLLMSISFSNALTGLLAAVPLIRRISMIMGARQTAVILEGANLEGLLKFTGLPPMLSRLSSILFFCWIVGFSTEFFAEYRLKFKVFSSYYLVSKGLVAKTLAVFSKKSVRALIFRQSILMFLLGFYSAELRLNIKPRQKIHILSAAGYSACEELKEEIFGKKSGKVLMLSPPKNALWGYMYLPVIFLGLDSLLYILFDENYIIKTVTVVLLIIFLLWFFFRFFAFFKSSLSLWSGFVEIKYFSGMNFTRSVFRVKEINSISITQSIFQQKNGRCNFVVHIGNSKALRLKIKHLLLSDIEKTASFFGSGFC